MARPRSALCERVWDIADCKSLATRKLFPQTTIKLSCMNLIILYRNPCINELSQWSVYCSILASEGQYKILILYLHPALQKLSILFTEKGQLSNCSFALSSFLLQDTCNLLYAYTEQFVACTTECVLITVQNSVTCCLERLNLVVSGSGEWWEVNRVRSGLTRELDHSRNRNHECREVASLTLAIAITNIMTGLHS